MKVNLFTSLLLASFLFLSLDGFGQKRTCGSHEYMLQQMKENPRFAEKVKQIELYTKRVMASPSFKVAGVVTIPVHVIVVYSNSSQNISDAQIQSQISVLNKDYRKLNTDWSLTPAEFINRVADVQIEFVLQGIERHSNSKASWGLNDEVKITYPPYSPTTHLNFWVATITGGYLGYAQFPGGDPATDGVVIPAQFFGSSDYSGSFYLTAPYDKGRTATHEVGHWLNLRHIWGDESCGNDFVDDTPTATDANYGCPAYPKVSCGGNNMFMNYMDYTDDACMFMFSAGQSNRIRAIFDAGGPRESFVNGGIVPCVGTTCNSTLNLSLKLDNYPGETSWILRAENGSILDQGAGYSTKGQTITKSWTLSEGKYSFIIYDSYGDAICCSNGNGSYTLTDGCGTTIKTGGSFIGGSELTTVCVGSGGGNIAPVAEANGPYTGSTGVNITFSSAGTTDSDGSIASYLWNFGDGTTSSLQNPAHAYATSGTYNVTLTVTDNSGATDSDVTTATVSGGTTSPVQLSFSNFESSFGIWTDGGNDCSRYTGTTNAYGGAAAIDIQDNSGTASSFYMTTGVDVLTPGYSLINVDFYFYAVSMESGEDFWVQYYNGTSWVTVVAYARGTSFNNSTFYHATVNIPKSSYNFPTNMRIRFMCDASDNNDDVYIDNITITASSGTAKTSALNTLEEVKSNAAGAKIEEITDNLKIYPNPAGDELTIDVSVEDNSRAVIYSLNGAVLYSVKLDNDISIIDVSSLEPGFYVIKVESGDEILTQKFIKK